MKKKVLFFCLLTALLLLCACGRNDLLDSDVCSISLYCRDGEKTHAYYLYDNDAVAAVVDALEATSAKKAPNWTQAQIETPLYGMELSTHSGRRYVVWTNGYWIDQDSNAWTFDFDFAQLVADTAWDRKIEMNGMNLPCFRMLARGKDGWDTRFLSPAKEAEVQAGLSMTVKKKEGNAVVVEVRNDGRSTWEYGAEYGLQVWLDGVWYGVPSCIGFDIPAILYVLEPADVTDRTYSLNGWGDLPSGQYRINVSGLTAEFTLN